MAQHAKLFNGSSVFEVFLVHVLTCWGFINTGIKKDFNNDNNKIEYQDHTCSINIICTGPSFQLFTQNSGEKCKGCTNRNRYQPHKHKQLLAHGKKKDN